MRLLHMISLISQPFNITTHNWRQGEAPLKIYRIIYHGKLSEKVKILKRKMLISQF